MAPSTLQRRRRTRGSRDLHAGWLELYFDLVFVVAIIQLGNVLAENVTWQGAARFAVVFVLLSWAWLGTTVYLGRFEADDVLHRVLVFAQMLAVANMAVLVGGAFTEHSRGFLLSFVANQIVLAAMYRRALPAAAEERPAVARIAAIICTSAALFLASAFVPPPWRYALWLVGFLVTFVPPMFEQYVGLGGRASVSRDYLTVRLGLFTIIVLGESFIKTIGALSTHPLPFPNTEVAGALCFVVAASLWWTYFDCVRESRIRAGMLAVDAFVYAHLPLTMGIAAFGVATKKLVFLELDDPMPLAYLWLTVLSLAGTLLAVAAVAAVTRPPGAALGAPARAWHRVGAAVALLAIASLASGARTVVLLSLVAGVCVTQIVIDVTQERRATRPSGP